jgi:hypothetical protein
MGIAEVCSPVNSSVDSSKLSGGIAAIARHPNDHARPKQWP